MAMYSSPDYQKFKFLLCNLRSVDNNARATAELRYNEMDGNEKFFMTLAAIGDDNTPTQDAELAAVLLRNIITSQFDEIFSKLAPNIQNEAKNQLLLRINQDINPNLKRKISYVAAELVQKCIDEEGNNHWPDFLKYLFDAARSPDPSLREIALIMFQSVPGVFGNQQTRYIEVIHQMLAQSLADPQSEKVQSAAVKAMSAFILANGEEVHIQEIFADCVTLLLEFLGKSLDSENKQTDNLLCCLVDLAGACPKFLRLHIDVLLQLCMKGISNPQYLESYRQLCLEVIVTLCESAPAMVKKQGIKHFPTILTMILKMMTEVEDDSDWEFADEQMVEDNDSTPIVAENSLDRIACTLGGKTLVPLLFATLPQLLQSSVWKERYACLMAISTIGEGCHKQMSAFLVQIVDSILPFLIDQHVRVRYAACNALGQMSTDFARTFQKKFHEKVIPLLLQSLSEPSCPRVQTHSGAALVNFFEDCPKRILAPYMDSITKALEAVLTLQLKELAGNGKKLVLEQVVVTLASLADRAREKFTDHYEKFMPHLKYIIQNANQPDLRLLRGKTIECVGIIGLAVGKDKFMSDASEVMDLLLKSQSADPSVSEVDPQLSYIFAAWARICKILGTAFKPYLPYVMPPVLKAAAIELEVAVLNTSDSKLSGNENGWEFLNLDGDKGSFGIRTAGLEEKATACQMLVCYVKELKEGFEDYVEETLKLMVPLLKFYFHDDVRIAAGEVLPALLESAKVRGDVYVQEMGRFIIPQLLQAIESEPEVEVLCEHLAAFARCLGVLKCPCLRKVELDRLVTILNKYLVNHFEKYEEREAKRKGEDFDEVLEDLLVNEDEEDVYLLAKISEVMNALFAVYKDDFFVYFDMLLQHFVRLIEPSRPWPDRQWSLCVFADVIEFTGPACSSYQQYFLQPILNCLSDEVVELRHTASYAIGVLGQFGGPEFFKYCSDSIPFLIQMINSPNSRSEENERATENAISAVTKIIACHNSLVSMENLLPQWLSWLPVWEDKDEVKYVYSFLCSLLEANNPFLLGNNNCNLPRIVEIIADTLVKQTIDLTSDLGKRIISLIKAIQSNSELFSACVRHLQGNRQEALHSALTVQ